MTVVLSLPILYCGDMIELAATLFILLIPATAHAWGAGTHLLLGMEVLSSLGEISQTIAPVIASSPRDFLYGCIAADIIVGKKYTDYLLNCHRWGVGKEVLLRARTPAHSACAYGYLAHLAADTIAHNLYVPYKLVRSFKTLTLKHAYWETRFDAAVPAGVWEEGFRIARENYQENDRLLRSVLTETIFSFRTNKRIFNSILLVSRMEQWQQAIRALDGSSRFPIDDGDREEYLARAREAVVSILTDPHRSPWLSADPTGEIPLAAAERLRKNLKILYQSGKLTEPDAISQADLFRTNLKESILEPDRLRGIAS